MVVVNKRALDITSITLHCCQVRNLTIMTIIVVNYFSTTVIDNIRKRLGYRTENGELVQKSTRGNAI